MNELETFKIQFNNKKYDIEKSNLNFVNGYAVVSKTITDNTNDGCGFWYAYDLNLMGVVDENFDTVFDFHGWFTDIQIFPEGNLIVKVRFSGGDGEQAYTKIENHHFKINGKRFVKVCELKCWDYEQVDETTIKVNNSDFLNGYEALYDVVKGKIISNKFTKISSFDIMKDNHSSEKFAKAIVSLPYGADNKNICDVVCYIDKLGQIRTPLYNSSNGNYVDTASNEFDFDIAIENIKTQLQEQDTQRKEEFIILTRSITPQK